MEFIFKTPLIVKPIPKNSPDYRADMVQKDSYEITQDFVVEIDGVDFAVPQYFRYDGASVPATFWQLTYSPFDPEIMRAAAVHDWFYYTHPFGETRAGRLKVDKIFRDMLKVEHIPAVKVFLMYQAVALMGWTVWENNGFDRNMLKIILEKVKKNPNFALYRFPDIL